MRNPDSDLQLRTAFFMSSVAFMFFIDSWKMSLIVYLWGRTVGWGASSVLGKIKLSLVLLALTFACFVHECLGGTSTVSSMIDCFTLEQ